MKSFSLIKSGLTLSSAKILRILASFYTFGITPRFLDPSTYGLVAVVGSSMVFLGTLDLGFGQGLRNKMNVESDNLKQAYSFYSVFLTLIVTLTLFSLILGILLYSSDASMHIFAIPSNRIDLISATNICLLLFVINVPFSMVNLLMMSFHEYRIIFLYEIANMIFNIILVTLLFIFKSDFEGDVFLILTVLGTLIINIVFTFIFIKNRNWFYKKYIPIRTEWINNLKDVFRVGKHYFLGALSYTVFFSADLIIVAQVFDLDKAGDFRILLTIFSSVIAIMQTYFSPLWDVSGKLFVNRDVRAITQILNRNLVLLIILFAGGVVLSPLFLLPILKFWTGRTIDISFIGLIILQVWFLFNLLPYSYNMVLNGIGKIKPIVIVQVVGAILKIPICIFFGKMYGLSGIIMANSIILLGSVIVYPLFTYKYLKLVG